MIGGVKLRLSYTPDKTCFAYLNSKYCTNKEQNVSVQVFFRERKVVLWAIFSSNVPDRQILCNPVYSRLIGLDEGMEVFVTPCPEVKVLDELYIDADSPDDQEILEHNAELLQLCILDQLRLVVSNQKAMVWIFASMPIVFTPKQTGILMNQSKVIVKIDAFNVSRRIDYKSPSKPEKEQHNKKYNNIGVINEEMLKPYIYIPKKMVLRVLTIDTDGKRNSIHPYVVFLHEDYVDDEYKGQQVILATLQAIPSNVQDSNKESSGDESGDNVVCHTICVEVVPVDHIVFKSLSHEVYNTSIPSLLVPKSLNDIIKIENGMKITLTMIGENADQPEHIHITTYDISQNENELIDKFKNCVIENTNAGKKFLINNDIVKRNTQISKGFIRFKLKPESLKYTMLNSESFRHCTVSADCMSDSYKPINKYTDLDYRSYCRTMTVREDIVKNVISYVYFEIHREACYKGVSEIKSNILITGLNGTGKSTLCEIIKHELTVWSYIVHCRSLKGRKDIPDILGKAIQICKEHSPSVLICDDVDSLVPQSLEGASPQDIAYYQRLAVVIKHLLQSCLGVCVVMTSTSMKSLHPTLRQFSGKPIYTAHFDIPDLDQNERSELLKFSINDVVRKEFLVEEDDISKMAVHTAGHNVRDLTDYLNKKIFEAVKKKDGDTAQIRLRLVEDTTDDTEQSDGFDIWGPVGGMEDVKQKLTESIFWPLMYPALFPSQSCGILLYGPPGTGKSYIGSCLARLKNMNFIAVKGPELLSKYIGQSEKAVRDIFDKADMKRPCILFFDEFDSLAPKRGHDSTGVTDRVVNQLLARLDGAEGGAHGPVVVATSRPDLVDPALLRAGRLQTHIYCALPDQRDRFAVLQTLKKSVNVSDEVQFEELATRTEGFSPADLKALLVTAQLTKLEKQLEINAGSLESVTVDVEDIESALEETKPSLSMEQRHFYDVIYKRFRGESLTKEESTANSLFQKQKVTLA